LACNDALAIFRLLLDFLADKVTAANVAPAEVFSEAKSNLMTVSAGRAHNKNTACYKQEKFISKQRF